MSWWDTSSLTNFASQASKALKNAQKKIDKVLDIDEEDGGSSVTQQSNPSDNTASWSSDSWSSWSMSAWDASPSNEETKSKPLPKESAPKVKKNRLSPLVSSKSNKPNETESDKKITTEKEQLVLETNKKTEENIKLEENLPTNVMENVTEHISAKQIDDDKEEVLDIVETEKVESSSNNVLEQIDKTVSDTDVSLNPNLVQEIDTGNSDRVSPIPVDSQGTTSSFEKIQSSESADILSLHSSESKSEDSVNIASDNSANFDKIDMEVTKMANSEMPVTVEQSKECEISSKENVSNCDLPLQESTTLEPNDSDVLNENLPLQDSVSLDQVESIPNQSHEHLDVNDEPSTFVESHFQQSEIDDTSQVKNSDIDQPHFTQLSQEENSKPEINEVENKNIDVVEDTLDSSDTFSMDQLLKPKIVDQNIDTLPESQHDDNSLIVECNEKVSDIQSTDIITPRSPVHHTRSASSESQDEHPSSPLTTSGDGSKLDSSMDTDDTVVDRSAKADSDSMGSVSPSSSYVKCMIEEAMDDSVKIEDNSSDGYSVGKSECSRSTGGHDSGDEVDTTTSSDIEIISTPTSNGDSNKFIDLSPLKIALQKTARQRDNSHRRNDSHDSQSSSSSHSRDGQGEQMSPGRDTDSSEDGVEMKITSEEAKQPLCRELPPLDEEVADPYNTQKLLKLTSIPEQDTGNTTHDNVYQKLAEMAEVLQAREDKLLVLSKENIDLTETNNILHNQIQQLENAREMEMEDVEQVTEEFTHRLSESEKLCQQAIREKEAKKKQFEEMQADFQKKMTKLDNALKEKEQTVTELLAEGEKLSKQQLQSNTIIKKLRSKEKETDSLVTGYRKKIDEQTTELEHLKTVLDSKDEMEKKQSEAINQLNAAVQKQERELSKLRNVESDSSERVRGLQAALDKSYKEIAELNKSNAALDSQAQAAALSQEMQIREELKATLEREQLSFRQEREGLIMQIEDLRLSMQRMEKDHNRREDMLRQEISDLQVQLQEDEARNQDLSQSVTSATRPLLRQIENLQSTFAAQSSSWEKVEKNLSDRLNEAQTQLATVTERERSASEKLMDLNAQITSLDSQNGHLRHDKSQLNAQLEILKAKIQVLEDSKHSETAQLEAYKQQVSKDMGELRKEKVFLETQLDMEKTKMEQEKKKYMLAQEQITQLEMDLQRPQSRESTRSPISISRQESVSSYTESPNLMLSSFTQDDIDKSWILGNQKTSLYESLRQSGAANLLENLQSQLKLREGEIAQLQSDIQQLERTRESMARELVNLTNQNESLEEKIQELPHIQEQLKDLNQRYNALLQMYGEKVEEADELRLDLNDVKEMYKMQIDHLLAK